MMDFMTTSEAAERLVLQRQLSCRLQETPLIMIILGIGLMLPTPVRPREHMPQRRVPRQCERPS
jgi:hypothetical protein